MNHPHKHSSAGNSEEKHGCVPGTEAKATGDVRAPAISKEACTHHETHAHGHQESHHHAGDVKPSSTTAYYCPMCEGVESDQPGDCPKCGMAL